MKQRAVLTVEYLRNALSYDQGTGVFTWLPGQFRAGRVAGSLNHWGYSRITIDGLNYQAHRLAWFHVHGEWPAVEIDHINGVRDDNRLSNLRLADRFINTQNVSIRSDSRSGFMGVSFYKRTGKWKAQIKALGRTLGLGYFSTPEEAHQAYIKAKTIHHPGFVQRETA